MPLIKSYKFICTLHNFGSPLFYHGTKKKQGDSKSSLTHTQATQLPTPYKPLTKVAL